MIELVGGTSFTHSFNPYAYFGHSWSYFEGALRLSAFSILGVLRLSANLSYV
jgi:hypothetical protein